MKRIVTVQDISAVGKCSLTVALPIISACGVECAVLPTAVLSTHTQFTGFTFHDLTEEMNPIAAHWSKENITFDAIYTGYLGSFKQIEEVENLFCLFGKEGTLKIVDPAMADGGKLYYGFTPEFAKRMAGLCGKADLILPNLTEASFMLDIPYTETYDKAYIEDVLKKLCGLGAKVSMLTGVSLEEGKIGAMAYDKEKDTFYSYYGEKLPVSFHGTGDIFSSALTGAVSRGKDLYQAMKIAVDYTAECIRKTLAEENHNTYGVNFEQALPELVNKF